MRSVMGSGKTEPKTKIPATATMGIDFPANQYRHSFLREDDRLVHHMCTTCADSIENLSRPVSRPLGLQKD